MLLLFDVDFFFDGVVTLLGFDDFVPEDFDFDFDTLGVLLLFLLQSEILSHMFLLLFEVVSLFFFTAFASEGAVSSLRRSYDGFEDSRLRMSRFSIERFLFGTVVLSGGRYSCPPLRLSMVPFSSKLLRIFFLSTCSTSFLENPIFLNPRRRAYRSLWNPVEAE